jgi:hypothetical protein
MTREEASAWYDRLRLAGAGVTLTHPAGGVLSLQVTAPPLSVAPFFLARQRNAARIQAYQAAGLSVAATFTDATALDHWWAATRAIDAQIEQIGHKETTQ